MTCTIYFDIDVMFVQSLGYQAELYTDDDKDAARYDHRDEIKRLEDISFLNLNIDIL